MKDLIYVGVAIGGTKTAVVTASFDGEIKNLHKETFKTNPHSDEDTISHIFEIIDKIENTIYGISIIVGSPIDIKKGMICQPPHLPGFKNTKIVSLFKNRYKVPVLLTNDADACALAEYHFGQSAKVNNLIYFTFDTIVSAIFLSSAKDLGLYF